MATPVDRPSRSSFGPVDPRSNEERLTDLRRIYEQVNNINRRHDNVALRDNLHRQLQARRLRRADLVQFEPVPDPRGGLALIVPGELLIRAETLERDRTIRRQLVGHDLREQPVESLDNRLVRLSAPGLGSAQLIELAGALRARDVDASLNYVTPMGGVMKGIGGPELSTAQQVPSRPPPGPGTPVRVAIIDTGIAEPERTDGWLTGLVRTDNIDPLDELPSPDGFLDFGAGHGTFVAGVVQQVAPGADIAIYQALDSDGVGDKVDLAAAMVRAVEEGAQILNLSFGLESLNDQPPVAFQVALEIINDISAQRGDEVLVLAAAGNFGRSRPCWPAALDDVVAVAGLTQGLAPSPWSSRGPWVDCSTLAEGVWSTYVPGRESPFVDPDPEVFPPDAWALWTGTSFAAPQIAGAVAKIAQEEGLTPRQALQSLLADQPVIPEYGRAVRVLSQT